MLESVAEKTLGSYRQRWKHFVLWAFRKRDPCAISVPLIADYLIHLFSEGYQTGTINTARSAINFFTLNEIPEDDIVIRKIFKYFFRYRPIVPKYPTFWPVSKVLSLLEKWHPASSLPLKELTLKTLALMALSSSDRGQTLHMANVNNVRKNDEGTLEFVIFERTKTTRKILKPEVIRCDGSDIEALNPCAYAEEYIERTKQFRNDETSSLFLSWISKKPVTRQSLSRWLREVLKLSGIEGYAPHSFRGASLTAARSKGASIPQIVKAGKWTGQKTFKKFYDAPSEDSPIGKLIISHFSK